MNSNRYFKKWDVLIYLIIVSIIISVFICIFFTKEEKPFSVEVYENGKIIYFYQLQKEYKKIKLELKSGVEEIEIKDYKIRAISASCANKLCIKQGWISHAGDMIVCIPNKLVIKIIGENKEVDLILK